MGFVGISNLPCLNLAFVQDSAPFLTTYAPNVTFGNLHYDVRLYIFLSHCDFRLSPVLCECYALFLIALAERVGDWSGLSPGNAAAHPSVKKTFKYQSSRNKLKQEFPLAKLCHFSLTSLLSCAPN